MEFSEKLNIDDLLKNEISEILSLDPRPQYQNSEDRVYGMSYKDTEIKFIYKEDKIIVTDIKEEEKCFL